MNETTTAGKELDQGTAEHSLFQAFDIQKGKQLYFQSAEDLREWRTRRVIGLIIALVIGVVIAVSGIAGREPEAVALMFVPYMIRHLYRSDNPPTQTALGEFLNWTIVLLGSITFIYPIKKIVDEFNEYNRIKEYLENYKGYQSLFESGGEAENSDKNTASQAINIPIKISVPTGELLNPERNSELITETKFLFKDLTHTLVGGNLHILSQTNEEGTIWLYFCMHYVDETGVIFNAIRNILSSDQMQTDKDEQCWRVLFGVDYFPMGFLFFPLHLETESKNLATDLAGDKVDGYCVHETIRFDVEDSYKINSTAILSEIASLSKEYGNLRISNESPNCLFIRVEESVKTSNENARGYSSKLGDVDSFKSTLNQKKESEPNNSNQNQYDPQPTVTQRQTEQQDSEQSIINKSVLQLRTNKDNGYFQEKEPVTDEVVQQDNSGEQTVHKWGIYILSSVLLVFVVLVGAYVVKQKGNDRPVTITEPIRTYYQNKSSDSNTNQRPVSSFTTPPSQENTYQEPFYPTTPAPTSNVLNNYNQTPSITGTKSNKNLSELQQVFFSRASATSQIYASALDYYADKAIDGSIKTSWQENVEGQGYGEALTVSFNSDTDVSYIGIFAGSFESEEQYYANSRLKKARIEFSQGQTFEYDFEDQPAISLIELSQTVRTRFIKITIEDVYPGYEWDDTAIAEVAAFR